MGERDWTPRPDPTALTTEALHREIGALRQLLDERLVGATSLMEEKFKRVDQQFILVERQRVEQKVDGERAIAAALQAAKEAVQEQTAASEKAIIKSENATARQLEGMAATFTTAFEGIRRDIDTLTQRVTVIEATKIGVKEQTGATSASMGLYIAAAAVFLGFVTILANVLTTQ